MIPLANFQRQNLNKKESHEENFRLLLAVGQGDATAFRLLYAQFQIPVYNTALGYLQNEQDAEEIVQEVFININNNAAKFKGNAAVNTWIYRITVNKCLDVLRKRKRNSWLIFFSEPTTAYAPTTFNHPGVLLENKEAAQVLFKIIQTLPDNQKTAFILSYIEGLPRQEVADIMAVSLKAVEALLQRGKASLRKKLDKHYPNRRKK